jgi:hypothetical protein
MVYLLTTFHLLQNDFDKYNISIEEFFLML